jgi:hypothetical protein
MKLDFAAPASFFSAAWSVHALVTATAASFSHFVTKLVLAAPASFFSVACASQDGVCEKAGALADANRPSNASAKSFLIGVS